MEYERCKNDWCTEESIEDLCPFAEDVNNVKTMCGCCMSCREECANDI